MLAAGGPTSWAVAVGAGAGVLAVLIGGIYQHSRNQRRWRSEVRLEAYLEFITAARLFLFRGADVGTRDPNDPDLRYELLLSRQKEAVREAMRGMRNATSRVVMLGPIHVAEEADRVLICFARELYPYFFGLTGPVQEEPPAVRKGAQLIQRFQDEAADTLSVLRKAK